jgi:glycine betaine/proline transport system ATP-binding protein
MAKEEEIVLSDDAIIECRNLWKIFGPRAAEALAEAQSRGADKTAMRDKFNCVIGVADASFTVAEGEIFCIMGLSGSGKSTLIRHINRLIEPTAGQVLIDGEDIGALSAAPLRALRARKIGMVFQHMALLPHKTIADNAAFALEVRNQPKKTRLAAARRALDMVELSGWEECYPDELSGGMQQRVGLARALAADPKILLMDEPFSALDPLIRRQLQDQFLRLATAMKKTTLFITHDLDEAIRIGSRIAIMKDGALVQTGTPEEIVTDPADDYVADFVAGISKLNLVTARKIMEPLDAFCAEHDAPPPDAPAAPPDCDLNALVDLAVDTVHPIVIKSDGKTVGVITKKTLLRGIQGKADGETSAAQTG